MNHGEAGLEPATTALKCGYGGIHAARCKNQKLDRPFCTGYLVLMLDTVQDTFREYI